MTKVDPSELCYGLVVQGIASDGKGTRMPGRTVMLIALEHNKLGYPLWKGVELWAPDDDAIDVDDDGYAHCTFGSSHSWSHP